MRLSHDRRVVSASFDDPNLVSCAGLVPLVRLAVDAGLSELAKAKITLPSDKGSNPGGKLLAIVAGMCAGADSIDDLGLLRHGGMGLLFERSYAPSTLGSFLRTFTHGHVSQLHAVASEFLLGLAARTPVLTDVRTAPITCLDVDDKIVEVFGYTKQGASFGYTRVRGLNTLLAVASTPTCAPVIVNQRLRKGSTGSSRGAQSFIRDALTVVNDLRNDRSGEHPEGIVLVRADAAFYSYAAVSAARRSGAHVSITVRQDKRIRAAIAAIDESAWTTITYPHPVFDPDTGALVATAQVAEVPFVAFGNRLVADKTPGRLIVRRVPDANVHHDAQGELFTVWRYHAFFTTVDADLLDTVAADKTHRAHAIIEQVHADLAASALAHLPSAKFAANQAWLECAVIAFNLTRTAATLAGEHLTRATTPTLRRRLIAVPARVATRGRQRHLHLPARWPCQIAWMRLFDACGPPRHALT